MLETLAAGQRGDRHRPGIILVGLVDLPGTEQPNPGGELGRNVHHSLTSGDQLLREQIPQPAHPFDRSVKPLVVDGRSSGGKLLVMA